jgi:hypothetical protein
MSQEHVFPQWLSKTGSHAGPYQMQRGAKEITTPVIEIITKRVCKDCNTGWMHRIEDGAQAVFEPLLDGTATKISEIDRWIIARWFTKTILTAQLAGVPRSETGIFSDESYQTFYEKVQPYGNSVILISGYQGPLLPIRFEVIRYGPPAHHGLRVFFQFHRLILTAFVAEIGEPLTIAWPHNFLAACHVIWPSQRGFLGSADPTLPRSWPPPYVLDQAAVELFLRIMSEPPPRPADSLPRPT